MSASQKQTPGVYIQEENAFPNSVVEVQTAIPAFIGYTETAQRGLRDLNNLPTRIASFAEYMQYFGGAAPTRVKLDAEGRTVSADKPTRFFMAGSLRLYFANGGGPCWIVSVGLYKDAITAGKSAATLHGDGLKALTECLEPTMVIVPDAVLLDSADDSRTVAEAVLQHCHDMQSRIGIFDVFDGDKKRTRDDTDVVDVFRKLTSDFLNYGVAYYPWLDTNLLEDSDVDYSRLTDEAKAIMVTTMGKEAELAYADANKLTQVKAVVAKITDAEDSPPTPEQLKARSVTHNTLMTALPAYKRMMGEIKAKLNVLPPSGGMAGVYARIDAAIGVQKAPANTGINSVVSPTVDITQLDQEDLNMPLDGKAINAIRTLPGRGMLVWGARTLDGNSQDWRYVNVRRTMIMLEQSIKAAAQAYVFEPNTALTWSTVKNMLINFLTNQWKAGVLMGAKPDDAFSVDVGLGSTMTGNDVLDGYMNVSVRVCIVRPAEFIVITFKQLMPTS